MKKVDKCCFICGLDREEYKGKLINSFNDFLKTDSQRTEYDNEKGSETRQIWACQKCTDRCCKLCGEPLLLPMGLDHYDEESGKTLHSPIFGIANPPCLKSSCLNSMKDR